MDKKQLSESDICDKYIRPAMQRAGWNGLDQIYREYPLRAGRVTVRGNKSHRDQSTVLRADYALFFKSNIPIAVVEVKDNTKAMGAGMAQAINYAELLGVPFSFSSNGDGFVIPPDLTGEERPFELPKGWALARFGDLAQISSVVTLGRKPLISKPLLMPYLRVANVQRWALKLELIKEVIIDEKELDRFQVCSGDLLITKGGGWDRVGRTAIWRDLLSSCLHQNYVFKARSVTTESCPGWAELYLNSDIARSYFAASAKQTTNLASINMTELKNCVFPLPSRSKQERIAKRFEML